MISSALAVASTFAVHLETNAGLPDGIGGGLLAALEVVFIAGIIPLIATATFCAGQLVSLLAASLARRAGIPAVRVRRYGS